MQSYPQRGEQDAGMAGEESESVGELRRSEV